jgi:hypothetical protein
MRSGTADKRWTRVTHTVNEDLMRQRGVHSYQTQRCGKRLPTEISGDSSGALDREELP